MSDGDFALHYQPQVDMETGHVVAVEAFVRWIHPQSGLLAPGRFIPAAERSGIIVELDRWVLDTACRQLAKWAAAGLDIGRMAVNVSPATLLHPDLSSHIEAVLTSHGLSAHQLELEMTEHAVVSRPDEAVELLHSLRRLGIRLSIDDFGTGYSSLSCLHRFQFDTLKVDGCFLQDVSAVLGPSNADLGILKAIAALAGHLSLDLVIEGVETTLHRDLLLFLGYRVAQGYLYCRPVAAEELAIVLASLQPQRVSQPGSVASGAHR